MEPVIIFIIALIELIIIGALVLFTHLIVTKAIGLDNVESAQKCWITIQKVLREPHRFGFVLWLIYGISFNCLIRSASYTVLQFIGVLKLHIPLGFVGEYVVTCICSFGGSFLATGLFKSESSSLPILYSAVIAVSALPAGLLKLIVDNKQASVRDWVLWSVSTVALSLIASLTVFKFVTFPAYLLKNCQLDGYESLDISSSADNAEEDEHTEGSSSYEQTNPTLKDLMEQGYTVEDVIQKYGQNKNHSKNDIRDLGPRICASVTFFIFFCLIALVPSGLIESSVYSYHGSGEYLNILMLDITQLVVLFCCGFLCLNILIVAVRTPKNYGWSVLIINIPFFMGCYAKDMIVNNGLKHIDFKSNTEFLCVEILWVPLKLAAVEF